MAQTITVAFTKMHSSGNDYIYVDAIRYPLPNPSELAIKWSAAHTGVGSDGLVLIGASAVADFSMRMFNADGSEARMCGNAAICVGKFLSDHHLTSATTVTLETLSGIKTLLLHLTHGVVDDVTVNMGTPAIHDLHMSVQTRGDDCVVGAAASMGNPHFVVFVDDADAVDLAEVGPLIEHHQLFPDRTNVEFAHICADGAVRMRVWERGSGLTQGCGSGACATAVAAMAQGLAPRSVCVRMDGGMLRVEWDENDGTASITARAVRVFDGTIAV